MNGRVEIVGTRVIGRSDGRCDLILNRPSWLGPLWSHIDMRESYLPFLGWNIFL